MISENTQKAMHFFCNLQYVLFINRRLAQRGLSDDLWKIFSFETTRNNLSLISLNLYNQFISTVKGFGNAS